MDLIRATSIADINTDAKLPINAQLASLDHNSKAEIILYSLEDISRHSDYIRELISALLHIFPKRPLLITDHQGNGGFAAVHRIWVISKGSIIRPIYRCFKFPLGRVNNVDWNYVGRKIPIISNSEGCVKVHSVWQVRDLGHENNQLLNVQDIEFIEFFQNLQMILRDKENPENNPRNIFRIIREVAIELQRLHDQGCIHRDLCPANIVVSRKTGSTKINDFDIAREENSPRGEYSPGKLDYMNLHNLFSEEKLIKRSDDYYTVGILLAELLFMDIEHLKIYTNGLSFAESLNQLPSLYKKRNNWVKDRLNVIGTYKNIYKESASIILTDIIHDLISNNSAKQQKAFDRLLSDEVAEIITDGLPEKRFKELEASFELDETISALPNNDGDGKRSEGRTVNQGVKNLEKTQEFDWRNVRHETFPTLQQ